MSVMASPESLKSKKAGHKLGISKFRRDCLAEASVAQQVKDIPATVVGKNAAAVLLGRLGGLKAGNARAEKLSPERCKEIAVAASPSALEVKNK